MLENGYIRLHRALTGWRWYTDIPVKTLWLHILLNANYEPRKFREITVERGQMVTSLQSLADGSGLTLKQVRTALAKLVSTGEVAHQTNRHYSLITVLNYDSYQSVGQTEGNPKAVHGQTEGNQRATMKESKKAIKQERSTPIPPYDEFGFSAAMRERLDEWLRYKTERKEAYKPTGLHSLLKTVARETERLGEPAVLDRITDAMASGWRGMNLDKMEAKRGTAANTKFTGLGERI